MKAILTASIFALSVSAASACGMKQSVEAQAADQTVVASVTPETNLSTPVLPAPPQPAELEPQQN